MNRLKNFKLIASLALILVGCGLITAYFLKNHSREITRAELSQLIQQNQISDAQAIPTPYSGIYSVEGSRKVNGKAEHFYVTTHLDDTEVKSLFAQSAVKIEMPGQGLRGQWINIVTTL